MRNNLWKYDQFRFNKLNNKSTFNNNKLYDDINIKHNFENNVKKIIWIE